MSFQGNGLVRHQDGATEIEPGDAFIFEPGQPHQVTNNGSEDLDYFYRRGQSDRRDLLLP